MDSGSLNATETGLVLRVPPRSLLKLRSSNLLPSVVVGREVRFDQPIVDELAARKPPPPGHGRALLVKLGLPDKDPYEQRMLGWDESWDEQTRREAARKYWEVRDPDHLQGAALVAAVVGFTVGVWGIVGYERARGGVAFEIGSPSEPMLADWHKRRLPAERGALHQTLEGDAYPTP